MATASASFGVAALCAIARPRAITKYIRNEAETLQKISYEMSRATLRWALVKGSDSISSRDFQTPHSERGNVPLS
jgi:hypothetical protein